MKPLDDDRLNEILDAWQAKAAPDALTDRMRELYRRSRAARSFWGWLIAGQLRVPVPALAAALAVVCGLSIVAWRGMRAVPPAPQVKVVVETRTVEVPVIRERVVERTVYKDRPAAPDRTNSGFRFVTALTPTITRSNYVNRN